MVFACIPLSWALSAILAGIVLLWAVLYRIVGSRPSDGRARAKAPAQPVSVADLVDQWGRK